MATTYKSTVFTENLRKLADKYPNKTAFAEALGVGQQTANAWLNGKRVPDAGYLIHIANKTGCSVDWLLGLSGSYKRDLDLKMICDYIHLSDTAVSVLHDRKFGDAVNVPDASYTDASLKLIESILSTVDGQHFLCALLDYFDAASGLPIHFPMPCREKLLTHTPRYDEPRSDFWPEEIVYESSRGNQRHSTSEMLERIRADDIIEALKPLKDQYVQTIKQRFEATESGVHATHMINGHA